MTRFREEHYASRSYRAWVKVQGPDHRSDKDAEAARLAAWSKEGRALRSEYFKKKAKGGQKAPAHRRMIDG